MSSIKPEDEVPLQFIGNGSFAFVYQVGPYALKVPHIIDTQDMPEGQRDNDEYVNQHNRDSIKREAVVYQRLGTHGSIAEFLSISDKDHLILKYYPLGNLERYMNSNPDNSKEDKATLILNLVAAYVHLHRYKFLLYDAALRNILISDDFKLKMIDFAQCTCFDTDLDINTVIDEQGMSAKCNIFDLGVLIYSIVTWKEFKFDLFDTNWIIPPLNDLPSLEHVFCGELIRGCWSGRFNSMEEVEQEARPQLEDVLRSKEKTTSSATFFQTLHLAISQFISYLNQSIGYMVVSRIISYVNQIVRYRI